MLSSYPGEFGSKELPKPPRNRTGKPGKSRPIIIGSGGGALAHGLMGLNVAALIYIVVKVITVGVL
jgi:hypothetical protein